MQLFFFNDCIPLTYNNHAILSCLQDSLLHYNELKKKYPDSIDGIVTYKEFNSQIISNQNITIAESIRQLENSLRTIAYSLFIKYPIEDYFTLINENIITTDHSIEIDGNSFNAFNLKLVADNTGVLFTLGLNNTLRVNQLLINSSDGTQTPVNNLYGEKSNTDYLDALFKVDVDAKLNHFDKLIAIIGTNTFSSKFESTFRKSSKIIQETIIEHFSELYELRNTTSTL